MGFHRGHCYRAKQCPILFVDEANRLRKLLRDPDGQSTLESFFEWLILHTNKKQQFHVLMARSDLFFNLWVKKTYRIFEIYYLCYRPSAPAYWETKLLVEYGISLKEIGLAWLQCIVCVWGVCHHKKLSQLYSFSLAIVYSIAFFNVIGIWNY